MFTLCTSRRALGCKKTLHLGLPEPLSSQRERES